MGGKQPSPGRTAQLSAGKAACSSVSKPLWVQRAERRRYGAPDPLETLLGVGIPGKGSAGRQPFLCLSALLSINSGLNAFFKTCLQLLHWKFYCHLNYDHGSCKQRKQNAITG